MPKKKKIGKKKKEGPVDPIAHAQSNRRMLASMASPSLSSSKKKLPVPESDGARMSSRDRLTAALSEATNPSKKFMGGKVPPKAYEMLTPQEIRDLKMVFDAFDTDGSGSVDEKELRRAMRVLGFEMSKETIREMIADLDTDNSGEIEFDEFLEFILSKQGEGRDIHGEIMQGFKLMDADNTGKISINNLRLASRQTGVKLSEQELQEMLFEADLDGDSEVSADEFIQIMLKTNLF